MAQPIITREKDGLRFEPTVQPGMVRCEACLELVEPSQVKEHICVEWWKPENQTFDIGVSRSFPVNSVFRKSRK